MPDENTPTGNRPDYQHPAHKVPLGSWTGQRHQKRIIGFEQRAEILEKFRTAREGNPALSKAAFARATALDYGVSASTILAILAG